MLVLLFEFDLRVFIGCCRVCCLVFVAGFSGFCYFGFSSGRGSWSCSFLMVLCCRLYWVFLFWFVKGLSLGFGRLVVGGLAFGVC